MFLLNYTLIRKVELGENDSLKVLPSVSWSWRDLNWSYSISKVLPYLGFIASVEKQLFGFQIMRFSTCI